MASQVPYFLTGANAKIRINNVTLAFCLDVGYSVRVNHRKPRVLGMFEPVSIEPVSYDVKGSFSIVRYVGGVSDFLRKQGNRPIPGTAEKGGNGIGRWKPDSGGIAGALEKLGDDITGQFYNNNLTDGRADKNLDPASLIAAMFFDLEIFQKINPNAENNEDRLAPVAKIRKCRITGSDFKLNKRSVATQVFTFEATYADEDSFLAGMSGAGQHVDSIA